MQPNIVIMYLLPSAMCIGGEEGEGRGGDIPKHGLGKTHTKKCFFSGQTTKVLNFLY